jgi:hypothetical protein
MTGGTISGNSTNNGGGVQVYNGTFTMEAGTISGNSANNGGGVDVGGDSTFTKKGGTIYGDTDTSAGNGDSTDNTAASGNGHAVQAGGKKRNADADPTIKLYAKYESGVWTYNDLSSGGAGDTSGNWE